MHWAAQDLIHASFSWLDSTGWLLSDVAPVWIFDGEFFDKWGTMWTQAPVHDVLVLEIPGIEGFRVASKGQNRIISCLPRTSEMIYLAYSLSKSRRL
jgi:hypothetical protein